METPIMIGLSVSFCVRDIAEGKVPLEEVDCIFSGTCARAQEDWDVVIDRYKSVYWQKFPDKAESIIRTLIAQK
jgi:hypothetical protein